MAVNGGGCSTPRPRRVYLWDTGLEPIVQEDVWIPRTLFYKTNKILGTHTFRITVPARIKWIIFSKDSSQNLTLSYLPPPPPFNPLTPKDPYRGRTAPLTSKVAFYIFIQQI